MNWTNYMINSGSGDVTTPLNLGQVKLLGFQWSHRVTAIAFAAGSYFGLFQLSRAAAEIAYGSSAASNQSVLVTDVVTCSMDALNLLLPGLHARGALMLPRPLRIAAREQWSIYSKSTTNCAYQISFTVFWE